MSAHILLLEDDPILSDFISLALREHRYRVDCMSSIAALRQHRNYALANLWILDRKLPDGDGLEVLRQARNEGVTVPALILTAMAQVPEKLQGFDAGADDYLSKPFSMQELVVRVRALMRRGPELTPAVRRVGDLELRLDARRVFAGDSEVHLTANEWRLLDFVTSRPGTTFDRYAIMAQVGVSENADAVAVDHLVSRLRAKLKVAQLDRHLRTVRGIGFVWDPDR